MSDKSEAPVAYSLVDKLEEAMRELRLRRRAFPAWVREGHMTQAVADRRIGIMAAIVEDYKALRRSEPELPLVGGSCDGHVD